MKYYRVNGELKAIPSGTPQNKIDAWVKENNAIFVKEVEDKDTQEGKTNGDVTKDASATPKTPASNQGTDLSNNNQEESTELESETGSSGYNHITAKQLQDYRPFLTEEDTAKKLEEIYGDNFIISEEAPGLELSLIHI